MKISSSRAFTPSRAALSAASTAASKKQQQQQQQQLLQASVETTDVSSVSSSSDDERNQQQQQQQHLVLIGGGHAHVQVIKALNAAARPEHFKVTLVDSSPSGAASYSGMVPGCVADLYTVDETRIDLQSLATWAEIEFINDAVVDMDLEQNLIYTKNAGHDEPIPFDVVSVDIGSTSRDLDTIPGARSHTIPTRPIDKLVARLDRARDEWQKENESDEEGKGTGETSLSSSHDQPRLVVVGGGVAGVELCLSLHQRWSTFSQPRTTLLNAGSELLAGESAAARQTLTRIMTDEVGICIQHDASVHSVEEDCVILKNGEKVPFDICVWATGAGAHNLAYHLNEARQLATTQHGWIRVGPTLQSVSHPHVFAAGDCAHLEGLTGGKKSPPKAGVYAVRAGPILIENLTRTLEWQRQQQQQEKSTSTQQKKMATPPPPSLALTEYQPQDDFMKLIVLGDGRALGLRFGLAFYGTWVMKMKDRIDQNFMNLFRHLPSLDTIERGDYDTSQYDEQGDQSVPDLPTPHEAAQLLQRTDDDVDWQQAWYVLRTMTRDEDYREKVLAAMSQSMVKQAV